MRIFLAIAALSIGLAGCLPDISINEKNLPHSGDTGGDAAE